MMEIPTLKAQRRSLLGTKHSRRVRAEGRLPGIIYGHGEVPEPISVLGHDLQLHLHHGARMLNVELDGRTQQYLIKDVQYDHLQKDPIHFDLARVDMDERVRVEVAIELRGTPQGVHEGGILEQLRDTVQVECLALEIPETLHPSVAHLGVGDALCVGDLELPERVVAIDDADEKLAIVKLLAIHAVGETPAEEVQEEGPAEPERIGRVAESEEAQGKSGP